MFIKRRKFIHTFICLVSNLSFSLPLCSVGQCGVYLTVQKFKCSVYLVNWAIIAAMENTRTILELKSEDYFNRWSRGSIGSVEHRVHLSGLLMTN